jgi:crotonobetainyl-CoA:carnitine CoA-transferase CaiB-like acyl-CoA transferase
MAAGGEMASSGYDQTDVPNAPPIAPGGGNAWHMGCHFAYMAIVAALVHRTVSGRGQYIDASIHEACALTTESAIANYIYRGEVLQRHTGRHHAAGPSSRTQFRASNGNYVCALVGGRLNPKYVREPADLLDTNGMAGDVRDPKYQDQAVIAANTLAHHRRFSRRLYHQPAGRRGLSSRAATWFHLGCGPRARAAGR